MQQSCQEPTARKTLGFLHFRRLSRFLLSCGIVKIELETIAICQENASTARSALGASNSIASGKLDPQAVRAEKVRQIASQGALRANPVGRRDAKSTIAAESLLDLTLRLVELEIRLDQNVRGMQCDVR